MHSVRPSTLFHGFSTKQQKPANTRTAFWGCGSCWRELQKSRSLGCNHAGTVRLQIARKRSYSCTPGPKVGIIHRLGTNSLRGPKCSDTLIHVRPQSRHNIYRYIDIHSSYIQIYKYTYIHMCIYIYKKIYTQSEHLNNLGPLPD